MAGKVTEEKMEKYQMIEDNGGGIYLFFFGEDGGVILGVEDLEFLEEGELFINDGQLDALSLVDVSGWEGKLDAPQAIYDNITSYDFGWSIVADQVGMYPDRMGRTAQYVFGVNDEAE